MLKTIRNNLIPGGKHGAEDWGDHERTTFPPDQGYSWCYTLWAHSAALPGTPNVATDLDCEMTKPFRWKNCSADVGSFRYGEMAQSYVRDVVKPSLDALESRITDLRKQSLHDDIAAFALDPAEELLRATLMGYCLSLQALWEKQIRAYLHNAAQEHAPKSSILRRTQKENWDGLNALFGEIRGVPLDAFDEFNDLTLLQLLGNVCRHGDGPSLQRLAVTYPELWVSEQCPAPLRSPQDASPECERTVDSIVVSRDLLMRFANAIESFWRETEYIYNESIVRKHPSLEARLTEERRVRTGRGRPWDPKGPEE